MCHSAVLQCQQRHRADQRLEADGLFHMELEPRAQDARAVLGTGEGREGGGVCDSPESRREGSDLLDQLVPALPRHREVTQEHIGALPLQQGERLLR
jgi:hypothetical protein